MLFVYSQSFKKPIKRNLRKRNRILNLSISYSDAVDHPSATIRRSGVRFPVKSEYLEFGSSWIRRSGIRFLVKLEDLGFDSSWNPRDGDSIPFWNPKNWYSVPCEIQTSGFRFLVKSVGQGFYSSWNPKNLGLINRGRLRFSLCNLRDS